jgi:hypothetical protein
LAVVAKPCGAHPVNLAEDKFAEDYCLLGLMMIGFRKWALEFRMSVLFV